MHKVVYKAICKASCLLEAPKSIKKAPPKLLEQLHSWSHRNPPARAHLPGSAQGPIQVATPGPLHDLELRAAGFGFSRGFSVLGASLGTLHSIATILQSASCCIPPEGLSEPQ